MVNAGRGNGKGNKKSNNGSQNKDEKGTKQDYICRICADEFVDKQRKSGQGTPNPTHHKGLLMVYKKDSECKRGHPKSTSHLCAWADREQCFKHRYAKDDGGKGKKDTAETAELKTKLAKAEQRQGQR